MGAARPEVGKANNAKAIPMYEYSTAGRADDKLQAGLRYVDSGAPEGSTDIWGVPGRLLLEDESDVAGVSMPFVQRFAGAGG